MWLPPFRPGRAATVVTRPFLSLNGVLPAALWVFNALLLFAPERGLRSLVDKAIRRAERLTAADHMVVDVV